MFRAPGSSPASKEIFSTINGVQLHAAFHYRRPDMTQILMKRTSNRKLSIHPSRVHLEGINSAGTRNVHNRMMKYKNI